MPGAPVALAHAYTLAALRVRRRLPPIAWAMLRMRNEHSGAFRGRYTPEHNPLGCEIVESQYWPHVRTVDVVGPPQWGKSFHAVELPTLYDLCEAHETVFCLNGSEDNAKNMWRVRWFKTMQADPVLAQEFNDRMAGGEWFERHFVGGGLLYSSGPGSASALSQRESRIVRCSELEKTRDAIGNEASSYALAVDRTAAYPGTSLVTSDCTITVRGGLSWKRFVQGDRSRPFIPCPGCGHYACPATERHIADPDLCLDEDSTHLFSIPEIASAFPSAAATMATLACRRCGTAFTPHTFRAAVRAGVWVPVGCTVARTDDPSKTPIPKTTWLDALNAWAVEVLSDSEIVQGEKDPPAAPDWTGPRLPDGISLEWTPEETASEGEMLPQFRADPRRNPARSFWAWRIFAPRYTLGGVAAEIVKGDTGQATGDLLDDRKNVSQKCYVLPSDAEHSDGGDLDEAAVLACVSDHPRGFAPANTVALTRGIDVGVREGSGVHWVLRAWTLSGESYLVDHGHEETEFKNLRKERAIAWDENDPRFKSTRREALYAALDRVLNKYARGVPMHGQPGELPIGMTYIDAGYMSEEVYLWCAGHSFHRIRPSKGRGGARLGRSTYNQLGAWNDFCERKALQCRDAKGGIMRHQYFEPDDQRRLMFLDADHWKKEVHESIKATARTANPKAQPSPEHSTALAFWLHSDLRPADSAAGMLKHDKYVGQVVAERWEQWINPRTKRVETGWRVHQPDNHYLDAEAYARAAAAGLGVLPRYVSPDQSGANISRAMVQATKPAPQREPQTETARRHEPVVSSRAIRRTYG